MQNILERVWFELWLVVLCLLWRPWYSLQTALCAATSWTRPIGPWPSPPQAALKPHWAGARMEEIVPWDWFAKSLNYSDFTMGPDWLCQTKMGMFGPLDGPHCVFKILFKFTHEIWGFICSTGVAAGFIILTESRDETLGNEPEYFDCKTNQRALICHFLLTSHSLFVLAWVLRWEE